MMYKYINITINKCDKYRGQLIYNFFSISNETLNLNVTILLEIGMVWVFSSSDKTVWS